MELDISFSDLSLYMQCHIAVYMYLILNFRNCAGVRQIMPMRMSAVTSAKGRRTAAAVHSNTLSVTRRISIM